MTDPPELTAILRRSADLHHALDAHLTAIDFDDSIHTHLSFSTSEIAIEHGVSICLLVEAGNLTSANVLLRTQFEAVTRAIWLFFATTDEWLEKYFAAAKATPMKDPNLSPGMDGMLKDIAEKAPPVIAPQLVELKKAAWGPLNSFVHSGIHPTTLQHTGYPLDAALGTIRNANGLAVMAGMVIALLADDPAVAQGMNEIQRTHLDCCPPASATPAL